MLFNMNVANKTVATHFGDIQFNDKGECFDLTPEQQKEIAKAIGYNYVEEKVEKQEVVEEKKPAARKKKAE